MSEEKSMDQIFLNRLNLVVESNLKNEQFGVKELAQEMGMSRSQIHRKLQGLTHQSISRFIREIRLNKAMTLLQGNVASVSEISHQVGFRSPSYFNKCFHDYFGYPPGEVKKRGIEVLASGVEPSGINQKRNSALGYRKLFFLSVSLLIFIIIAYFISPQIKSDSGTFGNSKLEKSIVVLPFKNLSEDKSNKYFTDGMMEDILNRLSHIHELKVISRISSEQYRGSSKTMTQIANELDVSYVLEGSIQKYENKVRIFVQLIGAKDDMHVWSQSYDRELSDIFIIQTEISTKIAEELKAKISPQERKIITSQPTQIVLAYDYYLKARAAINQFIIRRNELERETAIRFYKKACRLDPTLAEAYSGLGVAYLGGDFWVNPNYDYGENWLDTVLNVVERASDIDSELSEAYRVKGRVFQIKGMNKKALKAYRKAVELNPNTAESFEILAMLSYFDKREDLELHFLKKALILDPVSPIRYVRVGYTLLRLGFVEEAESIFQKAVQLQPDYLGLYVMEGFNHLLSGNFQKALLYYEKGLTYNPKNLWSIHNVAQTHSWLGDYTEAEKYFKKLQQIINDEDFYESPETPIYYHRHAYVLWKMGRKEKAMKMFENQLERDKKFAETNMLLFSRNLYYDIAAIYSFLNKREKALHFLEKASTTRGMWFSYYFLLIDPMFENLHEDSRFKKIVNNEKKRIGLLRINVRKMESIEAPLESGLFFKKP